jgi:hypothetical protein
VVATRTRELTLERVLVVVAVGTGGFLTGLFGVGGGIVIVPALTLALRFPMPEAVGTSLLVIAINAAMALAARYPARSRPGGLPSELDGTTTEVRAMRRWLRGPLPATSAVSGRPPGNRGTSCSDSLR